MLVSFYILAYNHEAYIADAIQGALSQTYSPLEIIISDDCSTDGTWGIIQECIAGYQGPHTVVTRRNDKNLGISSHINALWKACRGKWIVASAGDDVSLPDRVARIMAHAAARPDIKLFQSWLFETDARLKVQTITRNQYLLARSEDGLYLFDMASRLRNESFWPHGAAMAYSRAIHDVFGPMDDGIIFEDNVVNVRAEALGLSAVIPVPLVCHRNHAGQITQSSSGQDIQAQNARRLRRLDSDIKSTRQNLQDINRTDVRGIGLPLGTITAFFDRRLSYFMLKKKALTYPWPQRLVFLIALFRFGSSIAPLSRDDIYRSLLPVPLYRFLKRR